MLTKEEVLNRLKGVIYPSFEKDIMRQRYYYQE